MKVMDEQEYASPDVSDSSSYGEENKVLETNETEYSLLYTSHTTDPESQLIEDGTTREPLSQCSRGGARISIWNNEQVEAMLVYVYENIQVYYSAGDFDAGYNKRSRLSLFRDASKLLNEKFEGKLTAVQVNQKFRTLMKKYTDYLFKLRHKKTANKPQYFSLLQKIWPQYKLNNKYSKTKTSMVEIKIAEVVQKNPVNPQTKFGKIKYKQNIPSNYTPPINIKSEHDTESGAFFPRIIIPRSRYSIENITKASASVAVQTENQPSAGPSNNFSLNKGFDNATLTQILLGCSEDDVGPPEVPPLAKSKQRGKTNYQEMIHRYLEDQNQRSQKVVQMFSNFLQIYSSNMQAINTTLQELKDKLDPP